MEDQDAARWQFLLSALQRFNEVLARAIQEAKESSRDAEEIRKMEVLQARAVRLWKKVMAEAPKKRTKPVRKVRWIRRRLVKNPPKSSVN